MNVTIQFPEGVVNRCATNVWFIDPSEDWTVAQLEADLCNSAKPCPPLRLLVDGEELEPSTLCREVLSDGDTITVELR